jgi:hypothetical protein
MPAAALDCAGRAPASTALSLHSATRSQLTGLLNVSQSGVALPLPAALQNTPGSRMPAAALDCAGRAPASTALSLHSATRSQLTGLLNVSQSGVALSLPAALQNTPGSRMPAAALDCAGRASASTALSLHSATRFQLTGLLNVSQSGVALPLPAALQNAPGSRMPAAALDCAGRASASTALSLPSATRFQLTVSPQRKPKRRGAIASRRTPKHPRLAHARGGFGLRRQSASVDGAFTSFRNPLPADWSPQRKPKRRGAIASRRTPKRPRLAHARGGFGLRRQSASVDGAFTSFRNPLPADWSPQRKPKRRGASLPAALQNTPGSRMPTTALDCAGRAPASTALSLHSATRFQLTGLLNVSQSGVALPLPAALQNTPGSRMPAAALDCAGRAPASTALSLPSATRFQLTGLLNVSQSGVALPLPAALQNTPGSRMPATALDCAGRASASTALSLHSATRFQLTGLLNVSQSGVALSLPAALQNTPGSRMPAAALDCAGRAPASTALSLPSATRFQLTCLLNVSQSGVALPLPAALQNTPGSRMPATALDCAGRAPASTALSLPSATRSQLTGLLNVSQSGVALPLPAALQNAPGSRMPTAALDCAGRASASTALSLHSATRFQLTGLLNVSQSGVALSLPAALQNTPGSRRPAAGFGLRRQSVSVDGAFTSFRNPLPADLSPQCKPKRRGAIASRRTPKRPRLAQARDGFGLRRQSASVDGAFTSFRNPLPADWSPQRKPKRRGAIASRRTPKRPRLAHAHGGFGLRRQSVSVDGAFTSFRNPLPADWLLNVSQSGVALPLPAALQNTPGSRMPATALDCAGRASAATALSLPFTTPLPADWSPHRKPKRRGATASRRTPKHPRLAHARGGFGLRRQSVSVDGAFTSFRNPLPADWSPRRKPKRRGSRVRGIPAALQNAPGSRRPATILDCAGRAPASTALSLPTATRFQLTCLRNVSQSGVALPLPAALQNTPGSRMPTAALDCAGRASASTALSLPSATRFQLTGLLNASPFRRHNIVIVHVQFIDLETANGLHLRGGGCALEPGGRAPYSLTGIWRSSAGDQAAERPAVFSRMACTWAGVTAEAVLPQPWFCRM